MSQSRCQLFWAPIFIKKYVGAVRVVVAVSHAEVRVLVPDMQIELVSQHVRAFPNAHVARLVSAMKSVFRKMDKQ